MMVWTDYMKHRARLRGFDLAKLEHIVKHSSERYYDTVTGRSSLVGRHDKPIGMIPYEADETAITPITDMLQHANKSTSDLRRGGS